jgi:hypothetical protein
MRFAKNIGVVAALVVSVVPLGTTPVSAQADYGTAEHVSGCASSGNTGLYSGHSNEQVCEFGFFACVQTNPAASPFTSSNLMPPTTVGMIMMPFGADWHETGGNNGYVENVCNGRSGIFNVITMLSNINRSEAYEPFDRQLSLIQGLCGGQCRAEFMILSTVPLRILDGNRLVIRDNLLSGNPLEALMVNNYIAQGAVQRDGVAMGANGYHDDIINVMMAEQQHAGWFVLAQGYIQNRTSTANLTVDGLKIAFRILRFFVL